MEIRFLQPDKKVDPAYAPKFELRASIRSRPYPVEFMVQSAVDFESGLIDDRARDVLLVEDS